MSIDRPAAQSLLAFWADAGVDTAYGEYAVDRTATATPPSLPAAGEVLPAVSSGLARTADTLDALGLVIADFDGCPLKSQGARRSVCWRGAADAEIMIIGEAPGADEDVQGMPFVG